jgi:hypothetical protein
VDSLSSAHTNRPSDDLAVWADDRLPSIQAVVVVDEVVEEQFCMSPSDTLNHEKDRDEPATHLRTDNTISLIFNKLTPNVTGFYGSNGDQGV